MFFQLSEDPPTSLCQTLISADIVAYYNVVSRINNMMDVPSVAIADVLFPKNVEAMATTGTEKVRYYFERMVGTIISILAPGKPPDLFCTPPFYQDPGGK